MCLDRLYSVGLVLWEVKGGRVLLCSLSRGMMRWLRVLDSMLLQPASAIKAVLRQVMGNAGRCGLLVCHCVQGLVLPIRSGPRSCVPCMSRVGVVVNKWCEAFVFATVVVFVVGFFIV